MRELKPPPIRTGPQLAVVVGPGVSIFEFSAVWEVFAADPNIGRPWYQISICSDAAPPVPMSLPGATLSDVKPLRALRRADLVVVAPFNDPSPAILDALRQAHARGVRILSLCTGAFVLAAAGLLDGRRATTHWNQASRLADLHPAVDVDPSVLYVDDGEILTSAGSAACIDLCLHVIRADFGADVANAVARRMVVPPHRDGGQAQFVSRAVRQVAETDPFSDTLQWAMTHLHEPLSVEHLADRAAMSPRTFARHFRESVGATPLQWLLHQRVTLAQQLLETTDLAIDVVAEQCGLGTATNLRVHFQRVLDTAPSAYRRTFRAEAV